MEESYFLNTPGNSSLTHKELVSYVVSEPLKNKSCSLTVAITNAADHANLASKPTITQEEGYVASSKTHVEESFSETSKSSETSSTKDMQQKRSATIIASSKNLTYHIHKIIYSIYKDNIFQNNK